MCGTGVSPVEFCNPAHRSDVLPNKEPSMTFAFLTTLCATAALAAAPAPSTHPAGAATAPRPNILWISCEDTSPDLGCYGDRYARTPNLDRLATQGARFTSAFTVAGVCAPSRSGIITGMYPCSIGTMHMRSQGVPPPQVKCFTEYLRAAGYYCTNNVKTDYNFPAPLTAWDDCSGRAHWRNRPTGRPFFSVFNIVTTHESKIRASADEFAQLTRRLRPGDRHDPAKAVLPPYYPDTPLVRRDWANYYDLVTAMDLEAADLLKQLDDDGLTRDTIVFFWGDHGRGLPRAKRWLYDSGIHAPLIIRWPGHIEPGSVRDDLVSFLDFGPSLLSLAGIKPPAHMQGQPFLGPFAAPPRKYIFAARDRMDETYDIIRCVRDGRYKYIRNFRPGRPYAQYIDYGEKMPTMQEWRRLNKAGELVGPQQIFFLPEKPEQELYDTQSDPHEIHNLAADPAQAERVKTMRATLDDWMKRVGDLGLIPEDQLKEQMRPGGKWVETARPAAKVEQHRPASGAGSDNADRVTLTCETEGASIAYRIDGGPEGARGLVGELGKAVGRKGWPTGWELYTGPVPLKSGQTMRAKACRLGYLDSPELKVSP
jgi:N-sulfoglucosamine sulfohydrolase